MLGKRILTALWGLALVVAAVWFDEPLPWFTVLAAAAAVLGALEFYRLSGVLKIIPSAVCGVVITLFFVIYPHFGLDFDVSLLALIIAAVLVISIALVRFLPGMQSLFRNLVWMLTGVLYIGWLVHYLVALRLVPDVVGFPETGRNLVFMALFVTFGSDTAAFFVGRAIGRHKLAPSISPGKTWEGAVAGVIGAVAVSCLFFLNTPFQLPLDFILVIILGILVSVFGQLGDLLESRLKRGFGVKDSGVLMPGHGGILDRLDSILLAGVVVYLFYNIITSL